jgi:hypothetical protein
MDLRVLADVGEFLGGIGVIVSLVYLAIQIRGNTSSQRSENYVRSLERLASLQDRLARDHDFTKMYNRGLVSPESLTVTERVQFTWVLTEFFGSLEFMFYQAREGTIPRELWVRWEETLKWWLTFPGVRAWWHGKPSPFTPAFSECVEQCIASGYRPESPGAWEAFLATGRYETAET